MRIDSPTLQGANTLYYSHGLRVYPRVISFLSREFNVSVDGYIKVQISSRVFIIVSFYIP
jgi:hypothetical protein